MKTITRADLDDKNNALLKDIRTILRGNAKERQPIIDKYLKMFEEADKKKVDKELRQFP